MALEALLLEEVYTSQQGETLNSQHQIETFTKISLHLGNFSSVWVTFLIHWGHLKEGHSWIRHMSLRSSCSSLMITQFAMKLKEPNEPNTETTQHGWCSAHHFTVFETTPSCLLVPKPWRLAMCLLRSLLVHQRARWTSKNVLISMGRIFKTWKKAQRSKIWFGESNHPFWAMKGWNTSLFQENNQKLRELVRLVGWLASGFTMSHRLPSLLAPGSGV